MKFSRREILKGMGAAGLTPLLITACDSSSSDAGDQPPLPELPEYRMDERNRSRALFSSMASQVATP